mmetsp:Transcript_64768/g.151796  ORF Transcript_64768/g.151796 Transcript_64768/m.151796 type:complete len:120 (+) Transcript_64768:47-406(+)
MPGTLSQLAVGADFPVPAPGLRRLAAEDMLVSPLAVGTTRGRQASAFLVEAGPRIPVSFGGHGHHAPANADEALAQAKAGLQTCALGFMASSAALLSAYVTWSLEKHHQRHGHGHGTRH